jgi:hypothetical protein
MAGTWAAPFCSNIRRNMTISSPSFHCITTLYSSHRNLQNLARKLRQDGHEQECSVDSLLAAVEESDPMLIVFMRFIQFQCNVRCHGRRNISRTNCLSNFRYRQGSSWKFAGRLCWGFVASHQGISGCAMSVRSLFLS